MLRAIEIVKDWVGPIADEAVLDYEDRHRRRIVLHGSAGTRFLLDLADVPDLRDGDGIRLSSEAVVRVRAANERLMEIRCADSKALAAIAWHLGNRHLAAEIREDAIRIRADHVIADMVVGLGGVVRHLNAPFDPEGGAYSRGGESHAHG